MNNTISLVLFGNIQSAKALIRDLAQLDFIDQMLITIVKAKKNSKVTTRKICVVSTTDNLGYAKAHNQNFHIACSRYPNLEFNFAILNNDIAIIKGFKEFITMAKAGIVSAPVIKLRKSVYGYGRKYDEVFGRNRWNFTSGQRIDWVSGCAFCVNAVDFQNIKFDESFFMYAEDLNFCLFVREKVRFEISQVSVVEHRAYSSRTESVKKGIYRSILSYRNNMRIAEQHSRNQFIYKVWNTSRLVKNMLLLMLRRPPIILTLVRIYIRKLNNKDLVEFIHEAKI